MPSKLLIGIFLGFGRSTIRRCDHLPAKADGTPAHNSVNIVSADSVIVMSCDTVLRYDYVLVMSRDELLLPKSNTHLLACTLFLKSYTMPIGLLRTTVGPSCRTPTRVWVECFNC